MCSFKLKKNNTSGTFIIHVTYMVSFKAQIVFALPVYGVFLNTLWIYCFRIFFFKDHSSYQVPDTSTKTLPGKGNVARENVTPVTSLY